MKRNGIIQEETNLFLVIYNGGQDHEEFNYEHEAEAFMMKKKVEAQC